MENPWIPGRQGRRGERALEAVFPGQTVEGAPLTGGVSAAGLFRIHAADGHYVLRIETGRDAFRDPERHYVCLAIRAGADCTAAVLF